jgi:hypothetical protein
VGGPRATHRVTGTSANALVRGAEPGLDATEVREDAGDLLDDAQPSNRAMSNEVLTFFDTRASNAPTEAANVKIHRSAASPAGSGARAIASQAPCPRSGPIGCAASPSSATRPSTHRRPTRRS